VYPSVVLLCAFARVAVCQQTPSPTAEPASQAVEATPGDAAASTPITPGAQIAPGTPANADPDAANDRRMFGVLPNYKTINDPGQPFEPLSTAAKFALVKYYFDPFTFAFTSITASIEQATNEKAAYGQGVLGYWKRYGADFTDGFTNELFVTGVFPTLLHEDPRYYRLGRGSGWKRTAYALSRILVTRTDSGGSRFNSSEFLGNFVSGALSITYYPQSEHNLGGVFTRMGVEIGYDSLFNIMKEFYPDLKRKFRHQ
jgi:hypothetical protein